MGVDHPRTALIVGAGIGGLAAGLALVRAGWHVRVFERTSTPRELGFALGLAPNAIRALRDLGVADAVLPHAGIAASPAPRLAATIRRTDGRLLRSLVLDRNRLPDGDLPAVVMRPVLHTALLDALGRDAVTTDSEAVGFETGDRHVVVRMADGSTAAGDILIGADGVASAIRKQLHPDEPPPRPSGYFALRGASPAVHLLDGNQFLAYLGSGIEVGVVQASDTMVYWYVSLLASDVKGMTLEPDAVLRHFTATFDAQYPDCRNGLAPFLRAISGAATDMRLDELFERTPLTRWGSDRVTLLGDAAHPMLPHTGQGAAQALEDAVALGRALAHPGSFISALRQYERIRSRQTRRVVMMGPRIARVTTTRNRAIAWLRNAVIRGVPTAVILKALAEADPDRRQTAQRRAET